MFCQISFANITFNAIFIFFGILDLSGPVDVFYLLDVSRGVNDAVLSKMKTFVLTQARLLNVSSDMIRLGVVTYGFNPRTLLSISRGISLDEVKESLKSAMLSNTQRRIEVALQSVREAIKGGRDGVRNNVGKVIVLLVAGEDIYSSTAELILLTESLKSDDIDTVVVAMTPEANDSKIRSIATSPNDFIPLSSPNSLQDAEGEVYDRVSNAMRIRQKLDIGFILGSRGLNGKRDFNAGRAFIKDVVNRLVINRNLTQAGIILYGDDAELVLQLNAKNNRVDVIREVKKLQFSGDGIALGRAIGMVQNELFTLDRGSRKSVPKTVIILVNDNIDNVSKGITEKLIRDGVNVIFVKLGEMRKLTSLESFPTVFSVESEPNAKDAAINILPNLLRGELNGGTNYYVGSYLHFSLVS